MGLQVITIGELRDVIDRVMDDVRMNGQKQPVAYYLDLVFAQCKEKRIR